VGFHTHYVRSTTGLIEHRCCRLAQTVVRVRPEMRVGAEGARVMKIDLRKGTPIWLSPRPANGVTIIQGTSRIIVIAEEALYLIQAIEYKLGTVLCVARELFKK
jgi:hypothetical protein